MQGRQGILRSLKSMRGGHTSGKLQINLRYLGHFEKCQSDESELKWPPDSHLAQ